MQFILLSSKKYIMISALMLCLLIPCFSFAQDRTVSDKASGEKVSECMKNFDIDLVNFVYDNELRIDLGLLADYFLCRAVVKDSGYECDRLQPIDVENSCQLHFKQYHAYYTRMLNNEGKVSDDVREYMTRNLGVSKSDFDAFNTAIFEGSNDTSVCNKIDRKSPSFKDCVAFIKQNGALCGNLQCKYKILYFQALKNKNIRTCAQITHPKIRLMCEATLSKKKNACEQLPGYKEFREKYCARNAQ